MSSTDVGGDWYVNITVFVSDYVPGNYSAGSSVEANHNLLAGLRENDFDTTDTSYTYGLLTLAMVFLVAGLLACILLPCCYACMGKSRQERLAERLNLGRKSHAGGNLLMVVASIAAIATSAGAVWGLEKTDTGLTQIEGHTQDVANDLRSVLSLPNDTTVALDGVTAAYDALLVSVGDCAAAALLTAALEDAVDIDALSESLQSELDNLNSETLNDLADDVQGVSDAVDKTEGVRKGVVWPALTLSMLIIVIFIVIGVSTYEFVACGVSDCGPLSCCITPWAIFLTIVIWLSAASAVSLSALSGDFCTDPDANVQTLIADNAEDELLKELLVYYTTDCTTANVAVDSIASAQEVALPILTSTLPSLDTIVGICGELSSAADTLNDSLENLWNVLNNAAVLVSCENLNGLYQAAVYDELCTDLPEGLLGFWVSCVILTVLLLVLAVQWNRMLRRRETEHDVQEAEASARRRGAWLPSRLSSRWNVASSNSRYSSSSASARPAPSSGSVSSSSRPLPQQRPAPTSSVYAGSYAAPVQRPVEVSNPHRAVR